MVPLFVAGAKQDSKGDCSFTPFNFAALKGTNFPHLPHARGPDVQKIIRDLRYACFCLPSLSPPSPLPSPPLFSLSLSPPLSLLLLIFSAVKDCNWMRQPFLTVLPAPYNKYLQLENQKKVERRGREGGRDDGEERERGRERKWREGGERRWREKVEREGIYLLL